MIFSRLPIIITATLLATGSLVFVGTKIDEQARARMIVSRFADWEKSQLIDVREFEIQGNNNRRTVAKVHFLIPLGEHKLELFSERTRIRGLGTKSAEISWTQKGEQATFTLHFSDGKTLVFQDIRGKIGLDNHGLENAALTGLWESMPTQLKFDRPRGPRTVELASSDWIASLSSLDEFLENVDRKRSAISVFIEGIRGENRNPVARVALELGPGMNYGLSWQRANMDAHWSGGQWNLSGEWQIANDARSSDLFARVAWRVGTDAPFDIELNSRAPYEQIHSFFLSDLLPSAMIEFDMPPEISFKGRVRAEKFSAIPTLIGLGKIECGGHSLAGVPFDGGRFDFSIDHGKQFLHNILWEQATGTIFGDILQTEENGTRYRLNFDLNPSVLKSFLSASWQEELNRFSFEDLPNASFNVEGDLDSAGGGFVLGAFEFAGQAFESAVGDYSYADGKLTIDDLRLDTSSAQLLVERAQFSPENPDMKLEGMRGTAQWQTMVASLPSTANWWLRSARFLPSPQYQFDGAFSHRPGVSHGRLGFSSRQEFTLSAMGLDLHGKQTNGWILVEPDETWQATTSGQLKNGQGAFVWTGKQSSPSGAAEINLTVSNATWKELATSLGIQSTASGSVNINAQASLSQEQELTHAAGEFDWSGGAPLGIETFLPLRLLLQEIGIQTDTGEATEDEQEIAITGKGSFHAVGSTWKSDDLEISTKNYRVRLRLSINTITGEILQGDSWVSLRVPARSLPKYIPNDRLIEFSLGGTVTNPSWTPLNFTPPDTVVHSTGLSPR